MARHTSGGFSESFPTIATFCLISQSGRCNLGQWGICSRTQKKFLSLGYSLLFPLIANDSFERSVTARSQFQSPIICSSGYVVSASHVYFLTREWSETALAESTPMHFRISQAFF
jgi:hypothetical protein